MKRIFALASLAMMATLSLAQVDPNRTIVTVNGDTVKGNEYYRRMELLPDVGKVLEGGNVAVYPPGFLTIVLLIDERLLIQLAKEKGLSPTDADVSNLMNESFEADKSLHARWISMGHTEEELKYQFTYEAAKFKLQTEGVNVTDAEVDQFYSKNPPTIATQYKIRLIAVLDDAGKQGVDADLKAGKSFADVARDRSVDMSQTNSGEVGVIPENALAPDVAKALGAIKVGQSTPWIDSDKYHLKYLLEEKTPERKIPMDANLRGRLRRKLMLDKGGIKNNVVRDLRDFRFKAKIDIQPKEFAEMYKNFVRAYLRG